MKAFLKLSGWQNAVATPITPDWSPRHYWRLRKVSGDTAILVHAPTDIPGHSLDDFARLSERLRIAGLSTPKVYADTPAYMLIEDFGDTPIDTPNVEREAYACAVDVLPVLSQVQFPAVKYEDGYIYKKLALFSDDPKWMAAWKKIMASLPPCPYVFSHMDYKAGNLHWLPDRTSIKRIGILDFQAAQMAPFTYDIVNLLEDARRNLEPNLKAELKARFKSALPAEQQSIFDDWYTVMAAQFHARVLGQIRGNARVAVDIEPRLRGYLKDELAHPALAEIRAFFADL